MFPKLDDTTRKDRPRALGDAEISSRRPAQRLRLATLGIGAAVAATFVMTPGGPAKADNPPPGLLAKIQIATYAFNRAPTLIRTPTTQRVVVRRVVRGR